MKTMGNFYVPRKSYRSVGGRYEVDSEGKVYSVKDGVRFEMSLLGGGRYVNLCEGGKMKKVKVSYLVARAFVPNMEMRPYVVHKNGDTSDNRASNLEWSETEERLKPREGATKPRRVMCSTGVEFGSVTEAAERMCVSRAGIMRCISGKQKTCGGYRWYEI